MTPKPDAPVLERHRRMAARWMRLSAPQMDRERVLAEYLANLERDAHAAGKAEGVKVAAKACDEKLRALPGDTKEWWAVDDCCTRIRALLPKPPSGGACTCEKWSWPGRKAIGHGSNPRCPVHGAKGGER